MSPVIRFARSARKHRIGRAHAMHVIQTAQATLLAETGTHGDDQLHWVGADDRGLELEIVALVLPGVILVIHVMPTALRRGKAT